MAKKEIMTDLWVYDMLKEIGVQNDFYHRAATLKRLTRLLLQRPRKGQAMLDFLNMSVLLKIF